MAYPRPSTTPRRGRAARPAAAPVAAGRAPGPAVVAFLAPLAVLAAQAGCQHDVSSEFPPGLEPLEPNQVPQTERATRAEALATRAGHDGYHWAHGRGYVFAPPGEVWAATKVPATMYARCNTDERTATLDAEPGYEFSFTVRYAVYQVITVAWDDHWRYGTIEGVPAAPARAMIRHQKVEGSSFLSLSEGAIQVLATEDPGVTEVQFVEHLDAVSGDAADLVRGMQDNFGRLVAAVHGAPTPACPP